MQRARRLGVLVIGQTPRDDLVAPILARLGNPDGLSTRSTQHGKGPINTPVIHQAGALDNLAVSDLPIAAPNDPYPLVTRLADGAVVRVSEGKLAPLLSAAARELLARDPPPDVIALLCAGTFRGFELPVTMPTPATSTPEQTSSSFAAHSSVHTAHAAETEQPPPAPVLLRPFELGMETLRAQGAQRLLLLTPPGQETPIATRWAAEGFDVQSTVPLVLAGVSVTANIPDVVAALAACCKRTVAHESARKHVGDEGASVTSDDAAWETVAAAVDAVVIDYVGGTSVGAQLRTELAKWQIPIFTLDLGELVWDAIADAT